jgi:hypothetical protein
MDTKISGAGSLLREDLSQDFCVRGDPRNGKKFKEISGA